jgi:hypothetical protein
LGYEILCQKNKNKSQTKNINEKINLKKKKKKKKTFESSDGIVFASLRGRAAVLQIFSSFFVESYVACKTLFFLWLRLEEKWHI